MKTLKKTLALLLALLMCLSLVSFSAFADVADPALDESIPEGETKVETEETSEDTAVTDLTPAQPEGTAATTPAQPEDAIPAVEQVPAVKRTASAMKASESELVGYTVQWFGFHSVTKAEKAISWDYNRKAKVGETVTVTEQDMNTELTGYDAGYKGTWIVDAEKTASQGVTTGVIPESGRLILKIYMKLKPTYTVKWDWNFQGAQDAWHSFTQDNPTFTMLHPDEGTHKMAYSNGNLIPHIGKVFLGWANSKTATEPDYPYQKNGTVTVTKANATTTLYGVWGDEVKPVNYTVTWLNEKGVTVKTETRQAKPGTTVSENGSTISVNGIQYRVDSAHSGNVVFATVAEDGSSALTLYVRRDSWGDTWTSRVSKTAAGATLPQNYWSDLYFDYYIDGQYVGTLSKDNMIDDHTNPYEWKVSIPYEGCELKIVEYNWKLDGKTLRCPDGETADGGRIILNTYDRDEKYFDWKAGNWPDGWFYGGRYGCMLIFNTYSDTDCPVSVEKTSNATGPVTPGSTVEYTITLTNNSSETKTVNLVDVLPAGLTLTGENPNSTFEMGPNEVKTITYSAVVGNLGTDGNGNAITETTLTNVATVTVDGKTNSGDATITVNTPETHIHHYTQTKAPTCTEKGEMACSCGDKQEINPLGHVTGKWFDGDTKNAKHTDGCTTTQHKEICTRCDAVLNTEDHTYGAGTEKAPATCETDGVMEYTCTVCGHKKTEPISKLNHDWEIKDEGESGHGWVCKNDPKHTKPAEAHNYPDEWTVTKPATETEPGEQEKVCEDCGHKHTETIPAKGKPVTPPVNPDPVYYYTLTINYVDGDGNAVADRYVSGNHSYGWTYRVPSPAVEGYTPDQAEVAGTLTRDTTLTVTYTVNTHTVTVTPVDEDGNRIGEDVVVTVPEGEEFTVPVPAVEGYTPDQTEVTGTMGTEDITITLPYTADEPTDIGDENPPLTEDPDAEDPGEVDIGDGDTPLVENPDPETPDTEDPGEVDIGDGDTPLTDVPQTGEESVLLWAAAVLMSGVGLLYLNTGKRKEEL